MLASGNANGADEVAAYAFYALVLGVAIQLVVAVREGRKRSPASDSSTSEPS